MEVLVEGAAVEIGEVECNRGCWGSGFAEEVMPCQMGARKSDVFG